MSDGDFFNRYQQYSSSFCSYDRNLERQNVAKAIPKQDFEIDMATPVPEYREEETRLKQINEQTSQQPPLAEIEDTSVIII